MFSDKDFLKLDTLNKDSLESSLKELVATSIELNVANVDLTKSIEELQSILNESVGNDLDFEQSSVDLMKSIEELQSILNESVGNDLDFEQSSTFEDLQSLLEKSSFVELESNISVSEQNITRLIKDTEKSDFCSIAQESNDQKKQIPDPNLTVNHVVDWMFEQVNSQGTLCQKQAAWYIREYFGERFTYLNKNSNLAISKEVLKKFLIVSCETVVWSQRQYCWRLRNSSDPLNCRRVNE